MARNSPAAIGAPNGGSVVGTTRMPGRLKRLGGEQRSRIQRVASECAKGVRITRRHRPSSLPQGLFGAGSAALTIRSPGNPNRHGAPEHLGEIPPSDRRRSQVRIEHKGRLQGEQRGSGRRTGQAHATQQEQDAELIEAAGQLAKGGRHGLRRGFVFVREPTPAGAGVFARGLSETVDRLVEAPPREKGKIAEGNSLWRPRKLSPDKSVTGLNGRRREFILDRFVAVSI